MAQQNTLDQKLDLYSQQNHTHRQRKKIDPSSLLGYSIAAGMAMIAPDAMAAIVYNANSFAVFASAASSSGFVGSTTGWDINGDSNVDVFVEARAFFNNTQATAGFEFRSFGSYSVSSANQSGILGFGNYASQLNPPSLVGPSATNVTSGVGGSLRFGSTGTIVYGDFPNYSTGFIGLMFDGDHNTPGAQTLYAWARISFYGTGGLSTATKSSLTILEWAYDDSGAPIQVGAVSAVPLPGAAGLMLLGMGSLGLSALRKRKQQYLEKQQAKTETA